MTVKMKKLVVVCIMSISVLVSVYAQKYVTYAASSNMNNQTYKKSDAILIVSNAGDFLWNRVMEESLRSAFRNKGVSVYLLTDYMDLTAYDELDYDEYLSVIDKTNVKFFLEIMVEDLYTYTLGDGIKQFKCNAYLYECTGFDSVLRIGLATEADTNDQLSYNATMKPAMESTAKALVDEYLKHVK